MKEDLFQILSKNCNFGVKYYVFKYNQIPVSRVYNVDLNLEYFTNEIKSLYPSIENLSHNQHFYLAASKPVWELNEISFFFEAKEKVVIQYEGSVFTLSTGTNIESKEIELIEAILLKCQLEPKETEHKFSMIKKSEFGSYEMTNFNIKKLDLNINENYNDDLVKLNPMLIGFLNSTDETGIVLFHGLPGAGKTTYIRSLISNCTSRFIYMPNNIIHYISQPDFISFISSFPASVLVLEDCEEIIKTRDQNDSSLGITNLLNLGDGLLGDALKLKIVCTFNCELKKIDKALLRKGRLKYRYEFGRLSTEKSNNLFRKLKINETTKEPLTIAEIYNYTYENNANQEEKVIGFMSE